MSGVQTENGYTRIANELLEQISRFKFNGTEFRILMIVWRYTYGFNRKGHALSTSFIAEAIGIDNSRVRKVLKKLIDTNVISVLKEATFNESRVLSFNKNYRNWGVESDGRGQEEPHPPKRTQPEGSNKTQPQGSKRTQPQGSKTTPKKDIFKDSIKESIKDNRPSPVVIDKSFGEIISFYEQNVGMISPHVSQELGFLVDENNDELVLCALKKSVEVKPSNYIRYMQGILKNWKNHNVKTLEDVQKADALPRKSNVQSLFAASPETLERQRQDAEKYKDVVIDTSDLPY
ncbi:replication protein [Sporosarcina sp. FA9]|uniref:replication protein n=1 Tax=Sporosarcina sp. FA9 TaxID=3413030 RepID=UPI003F656711